MNNVEKKIIFPDNSYVRYYHDLDTGLKTLNMDDVAEVLKGSEENRNFLLSQMGDFTLSQHIPPKGKKKEKKIVLSDFNQKLKQAANFNPNKDKK